MKKPRAKPVYAYAIKSSAGLELESLDYNRAALIEIANKPAGESVVPVRISQIDKHPASQRRGGET